MLSFFFVFWFLCLFLYRITYCQGHSMTGTVYYDEDLNLYNLSTGIVDCDKGIACGIFNDSLNQTGWSILDIKTDFQSDTITDYNRFYASGYLEGALSSYEIHNYYVVAWENYKDLVIPFKKKLIEWNGEQREWINKQIELNTDNNPLWMYMNNLMAQYDGLLNGYNYAATNIWNNKIPQMNTWDFSLINAVMDWVDIIEVLIITNETLTDTLKLSSNWYNLFKEYQKLRGLHCSGLVKVTPTFNDLFFSHSTWISYFMMNRIYKNYIFKSTNTKYPSTKMSFSSYPSIDDYYIMNSGLAVMETTNDQLNPELWKYCNTQQLFTWMRVRVANQLSSSGKEWVSYFEQYNSGTYNNQWMILDYKLFKIGEPLNDNLLWIAEQIPGNVTSKDVTNILEKGYWASYNIPAIEYIYKESGNAENAIRGSEHSYDLAPRARIFRRDANNATNIGTIKKIMRYNNYLTDKIENGNPIWAIMARGDLSPTNGEQSLLQLFGGIDTKIANLTMLNNIECIVKAGPTNDDLDTFKWSDPQWIDRFHYALPNTYDFEWIQMTSLL